MFVPTKGRKINVLLITLKHKKMIKIINCLILVLLVCFNLISLYCYMDSSINVYIFMFCFIVSFIEILMLSYYTFRVDVWSGAETSLF